MFTKICLMACLWLLSIPVYGDQAEKEYLLKVQQDNKLLLEQSGLAIEPDEIGQIIPIKQEWTGAHSGIKEENYFLIDSKDQLDQLWKQHAPGISVPEVNFHAFSVIAVFGGELKNIKGYKAYELKQYHDFIRLRLDDDGYQTIGEGDKVTPFAIYVVPLITKKVLIQLNAPYYKGPRIWKIKKVLEVEKPAIIKKILHQP